jgi:hypothetical protein
MRRLAGVFTPKFIYAAFALTLALLLFVGVYPPVKQPDVGPRAWLMALRAVAGYAVAFVLCVAVAGEHRRDSWFRVAWMAFAVNAAASIVRHAADTPLWDLMWPGYSSGVAIAIIRQSAIVIGLGALLAGVIAIVWAFHRMGIGLSPRRWDIAAIAAVFAVLATIFYFREGLAEFHKASALARYLQQLGLILLAAGAACSILVYRLARQMSGGRLALTMLAIVIYTVLRCVLVCVSLVPPIDRFVFPFNLPLELSVPWLFALAAAYRSGIAFHGAAQIPKSSPVSPYVKQTFPVSTRIS